MAVSGQVFLVILTLSYTAGSSRVIDRFGGRFRQDCPCRMMWAKKLSDGAAEYSGAYPRLDITLGTLFNFAGKINCSLEFVPFDDLGVPDDNGTYNGGIGIIQRQEADVHGFLVRPDSLPFEPGIIGPVILEGDATIVSRKNLSKPIAREIVSFVEDFDEVTYAYAFLVILLFCITYTAMEFIIYTDHEMSIDTLHLFLDTLNDCLSSALDQMSMSPSKISLRILAASFGLFIYVLIYGYVSNEIGSNLVINKTPPTIDSLDYFLKNDSWTRPVVVRTMYLPTLFRSSHPESKFGQMWKVIASHPKESLWDINLRIEGSEIITRFIKLVSEINDSSKALIAERYLINKFSKAGCAIQPKLVTNLFTAKKSFAEGYLGVLFSHGIHPYVRKVFEYYLRTVHEGAYVDGLVQTIDSSVPDIVSTFRYSREVLDCLTVKSSKPDEEEWRPFTVADLKKVFYLFGIGSVVGGGILFLVEVIYLTGKRAKLSK